MTATSPTTTPTTTLPDAIESLGLDDVLAIREEIALRGLNDMARVTSTDDDDPPFAVVDQWTGKPLTVAQALRHLDEEIADMRAARDELEDEDDGC